MTVTDVELTAVLGDIRSGLDQAATLVDGLVAGVDDVLAGLPDADVAGARMGLVELRRRFTDAVDRLDHLLATAGDTTVLRRAGAAWVDAIGATTSRLAAVASLNITRVDDHWTGLAADAYRNTLPAQQAALSAITFTSHEVDATLNDLASAIVRFWISIGAACVGLVVTLAGALGSAATVVGAPLATGIALAGVGALATAGTAAISNLTDITTGAAARSAELERRLATDTTFPLGAWPRSTTEISPDASITDGDGSDWHLR